jgi:hypothetical protein
MAVIGIITRFPPESRAITATDAAAFAGALAARAGGHRIRFFCASGAYDGAHAMAGTQQGFEVVRLEAGDPPKTGLRRLLDSLKLGARLAWAARDCDVVVAQTDPPLLGLWVGALGRLRGIPWVDWTMDLYPDAFVAAGLAPESSIPIRLLRHLERALRPTATIALGEGQARYLRSIGRAGDEIVLLPCGVPAEERAPAPPRADQGATRTIRGTYAGNIGQAHDVERVVAAVRGLVDAGAQVVVAPSGAKADALRAAVAGFEGVELRRGLTHDELAAIDFHIVSLAESWTHVCVPSKGVTAASLGGHVLFLGDGDSDSARLAGERCTVLPPSLGDGELRARCRAIAEARRERGHAPPVRTAPVPAFAVHSTGIEQAAALVTRLAGRPSPDGPDFAAVSATVGHSST